MINITLFGNFEIEVSGKSAESILAGSKKGRQMLIYLLINYGKPVSSEQLYDVLWPGESSTNPENALKALVSRIRAQLSAFSPELDGCIATQRGGYRWNTGLECNIDILRFEDACGRIMQAEDADGVKDDISLVMADYCGDLCTDKIEDAYSRSRLKYYHDMFVKAVLHIIKLFKAKGDSEKVVQIARTALDLDMFEEKLHVELIDALANSNRSVEALAQYRYMNNLNYSYMGVVPNENLQNLYNRIIEADQSLDNDVETIRRNLESGEDRRGAFVCDYSLFREVYKLHMGNLSRLGTSMYLAVVMLRPTAQARVDSFELDREMHRLLEVLTMCLRRGDTVSRYSPTQYAILLPTVNDTTGLMVIKRIRTIYYSEYVNPNLTFSFKLVQLNA